MTINIYFPATINMCSRVGRTMVCAKVGGRGHAQKLSSILKICANVLQISIVNVVLSTNINHLMVDMSREILIGEVRFPKCMIKWE